MAYAIGIDLGTTNSVAAVVRRGVVETIPVDGRSTLPSVVSFRPDGSVLVGQSAKGRMLTDPESTVASAKRAMGDRNKAYRVAHRSLTPVDIGSLVLKRLVEGARAYLKEDIWDAVITVPAYFTEAQREDTRRAGEEAGLNVLRLIPEPTAAAIAYGLDKGRNQTLLVYDFGGGTFDVSILKVKGNTFEVVAVGGDSLLGGDDLDNAIIEWAISRFQEQSGIDVRSSAAREALVARQKLKEAAEAAKIELSVSDTALLSIPDCLGYPLELELTLSEYNALIAPLLQRTIDCMRRTLADAHLRADDIDRVILVGGSTKNRAVRELVAKEIKDPYTSDRVDEVVAHGAAILAASLFLPEEQDSTPIEITERTGHTLGVDVVNDAVQLEFLPIIPRQTQYPCRFGRLVVTQQPFQEKVIFSVYRGEDIDLANDVHLGDLELPIHPPQPTIIPVGAIFELDQDGILRFTAVQFPPPGAVLRQILEFAAANDGKLDLPETDALIISAQAQTRDITLTIK